MEVLILVESWRNFSPCSLLFLLQLSWLSFSHLSSSSFSPLWSVFSPWLSPSRLPSSTLFFPPLASNSATSTEPPLQADRSTPKQCGLSFQRESATTRSTSSPSLHRRLSSH